MSVTEVEVNQSIDYIRKEINSLADAKRSEILDKANEKRDDILKKAKSEMSGQNIVAKAKQESELRSLREISKIKLSEQLYFLQAKEGVIEEILEEVNTELAKVSKKKSYSEFFEKLLLESALSIGGGELIISANKKDKELVTVTILESLMDKVKKIIGKKATFQVSNSNLSSIGGINMVRKDGKIRVNNTFESRLERNADDIRLLILKTLGAN